MDPLNRMFVGATHVIVDCVLEPALLSFMERVLAPLTFPAFQKLAAIISLRISQVYLRDLVDVVDLDDAGAVLMAAQAVEDAFRYLDDMRHAVVWSMFKDPMPSFVSLFVRSDRTFDDFMDAYLTGVGQRMGQNEFAGMEPPLPNLENLVFMLLLEKNLEHEIPVGDGQLVIRKLRSAFKKSATMYTIQCAALQNERNTLLIDIEYAQNRIRTGDFLHEGAREANASWLKFITGMLERHSLEPKPTATTISWFEDLDWVDLKTVSDAKLEKLREILLSIPLIITGLEREAALRRGVNLPQGWRPDRSRLDQSA